VTERDVHALRAQALATRAEAMRATKSALDVEHNLGRLTVAT
jgi:hypothetical protein